MLYFNFLWHKLLCPLREIWIAQPITQVMLPIEHVRHTVMQEKHIEGTQYYAKEAMGAAEAVQSVAIDAQSVANSVESECY